MNFNLIAFLTVAMLLSSQHLYAKLTELSVGLATMRDEVQNSASLPAGDHVYRGAKLAINLKKKVLEKYGVKFKLEPFFYHNSDLSALKTSIKACESNIIALHGYDYSSQSIIASKNHLTCKLPMFTPTSTANSLGLFKDYIFQVPFNNNDQAIFLAKVSVEKIKADSILVLSAKDCAYCNDLASSYLKELKKILNKNEVKISEFSYLQDELDSDKLIDFVRSIKKGKTLLFIPSYSQEVKKVISILKSGKIEATLLGSDGWATLGESVLQQAMSGSQLELYMLLHWHKSIDVAKSKNFISKYIKNYSAYPNHISALSFDTMNIIIEGVLGLKEYSREKLNSKIKEIGEFEGVTGKIDLVNKLSSRSIYLVDVKNGLVIDEN